MIDKSWDWILGYITAIYSTAAFNKSGEINYTEWFSAAGSVLAAAFAAVAAIISMLAIRSNSKISINNSKSQFYGELNAIVHEISIFLERSARVRTSFSIPAEDDKNYENYASLIKEDNDNRAKAKNAIREVKVIFFQTNLSKTLKDVEAVSIRLSGLRLDLIACELDLTSIIIEAKTYGVLAKDFHL